MGVDRSLRRMTNVTRPGPAARVVFELDGRRVELDDEGGSLLSALRDRLGVRGPKDGCSPQGQCGCCTVLVDGSPRVACVTPLRRVAGRRVVTVDGLDPRIGRRWAEAFDAAGASQCGFCTPGIICRFEGLRATGTPPEATDRVARALQAHLCRCTGWLTILDAWRRGASGEVDVVARDRAAADRRATLEGRSAQRTGPGIALGGGGFADDTAPAEALVAVRSPDGGWVVAETVDEARRRAGKVQGRRTTRHWDPPLEVPDGDWYRTLRTSWVEPAYLETDASWCAPGGEPVSPLANGGAFGAKRRSEVAGVARRLADEHGRPVRVLWSREDVVRLGPKRPPVAAGIDREGRGVVRVARTPGVVEAIAAVAPGLVVEEVDVPGPPTSVDVRGAGWVEAAVLMAARGEGPDVVVSPDGGRAEAVVDDDGVIRVVVDAGEPLDPVVLRSYVVGAAHMAWSWVTSESLAVDPHGEVHDLTIRSFGIVRALDMPPVAVEIVGSDREPVNGSDAVFAAVAAAAWRHHGFAPVWPVSP